MIDPKIARSRAQEARGVVQHAGRRNAGSGNQALKNDVRADDVLVEYKRTDALGSISIKAADLADVRHNALIQGREWLFGIELAGRDYVLMDVEHYRGLKQTISELQQEITDLWESPDARH